MMKYALIFFFCIPLLLLAQESRPMNSKSLDKGNPATATQKLDQSTKASKILSKSPEYARLKTSLEDATNQALQQAEACQKATNPEEAALCRRNVLLAKMSVDSMQAMQTRFAGDVSRMLQIFGNPRYRSDRLRKAIKAFEEGHLLEANRLLNPTQIQSEGDALLKKQSLQPSAADSLLQIISNEFAFKAYLEAIDFEDPLRYDSTNMYIQHALRYSESCYNLVVFGVLLWEHEQPALAIKYHEKALQLNADQSIEVTIACNLAMFYQLSRRMEEAEKAYIRAISVLEKLAKTDPRSYELKLARTMRDLGALYSEEGKLGEAEKSFVQVREILEQGRVINPEYDPFLATTRMYLGNLYRALQKPESAEKEYLAALEIRESLAKADPKQKVDLAYALMHLGTIYYNRQAYANAEKMTLRSFEILEQEVKTNPKDFDFDYASSARDLIYIYLDDAKLKEAEQVCLRVRSLYQSLEKNHPTEFEFRLAWIALNLGAIAWDLDKLEEAKTHFDLSVDLYERVAAIDPLKFDPDLAEVLDKTARLYIELKKLKEAEQLFQRALDIDERLDKTNPDVGRPQLANTLFHFATLYNEMDRMDEAEKTSERALVIYEELDKKTPGVYDERLAMITMNLGLCKASSEQRPEAEKLLEKAYNHYERLVKADPDRYEIGLTTAALNLGFKYAESGKYKAADPLYIRALEIRKRLAKADPQQYEPDLGLGYNSYGIYLMGKRALEDARVQLSTSIGKFQTLILGGRQRQYDYWIYPYNQLNQLRDSFAVRHAWPTVVSIQKQRRDAAAAIRESVPQGDSLAGNAWGALAWYLLFTQEYTDAQTAAEKALVFDPSQNWIRTNLGHAHLLQGNWEGAIQTYKDYLANETDKERASSTLQEDWDMLDKENVLSATNMQEITRARNWLKQ